MFEFLLLLFLSRTDINKEPMHLGVGEHQFRLSEPVRVLNSRAHLEIEVSTMLKKLGYRRGTSPSELVNKHFPMKCFKAILHGPGGASAQLEFSGGTAYNGNEVFLRVGEPGSLRRWEKFDLIKLSSCTPLDSVTLRWTNAEP